MFIGGRAVSRRHIWIAGAAFGLSATMAQAVPPGGYDAWVADASGNIASNFNPNITVSSAGISEAGFRQDTITDALTGKSYIHQMWSDEFLTTPTGERQRAESFVQVNASAGSLDTIAARQTIQGTIDGGTSSQNFKFQAELNRGDSLDPDSLYDPNREMVIRTATDQFVSTDTVTPVYSMDFVGLRGRDVNGNEFQSLSVDQRYQGSTATSPDVYDTRYYYREKSLIGAPADPTVEYRVVGYVDERPSSVNNLGLAQHVKFETRSGAAVAAGGSVYCRSDAGAGSVLGQPLLLDYTNPLSPDAYNWNPGDTITLQEMSTTVTGVESYGHYFYDKTPQGLGGNYRSRPGVYGYDSNFPYCAPISTAGYQPFVTAPANPDPFPTNPVVTLGLPGNTWDLVYTASNPFNPSNFLNTANLAPVPDPFALTP